MKKPSPCFWFDSQAEDAAKYYASIFPHSKIERVVPYGTVAAKASGRPVGSIMTVAFELAGTSFVGINGGPLFPQNPSISFFVGCDSEGEIATIWEKLHRKTRMDLQKYPFAEKYGWCEDRFGVNWQLILAPRQQKISPALLFANDRYGKAKEAVDFYASVFPDSKVERIARDEKTGAVLHSVVRLCGQEFVLFEGPLDPSFTFSPAVSFIVNCESQAEIDAVWTKLSAVPEAEQCGWLQDKFGVSWQVVHEGWGKSLGEADPAKRDRLMAAILKMKKPDLKKLEQA